MAKRRKAKPSEPSVYRLSINGILGATGMENEIKPTLTISFVSPYQPSGFSFDGHMKKVKPTDVAGWDTPIMLNHAK